MLRHTLLFPFLGLLLGANSNSGSSQNSFTQWSGWGGNYHNNGWASQNNHISSSNIKSLTSQCNISYRLGVSSTPVVHGNTAYYPTWNGSFVALDYISCRILWQINVTDIVDKYAPFTQIKNGPHAISRTSPQIDGDVMYFGTHAHALAVAVNRLTGALLATLQINPHPKAIITMSPTFFDGKLFVGASSLEENFSLDPTYPCCSFVGNMVALKFDGKKFSLLWNVSMIPEAQSALGWSGAALWGSQPAIDTKLRQVFVGTGNTYSIPQVIIDCQHATENITAVVQGLVPDSCLPANIWQESVLAIDIDLGIVNWVHQFPPLDAYTAGCGYQGIAPQNTTLCPEVAGEDADFAMAPTFVPGSSSTPYGKDTLVIGQKNANLYALSAQTGTIFWTTVTGPGGIGGGLAWGVAVDDSRIYFVAVNSGEETWAMQPSNILTNRSAYGAASLLTGALLWEVAVPGNGVAYGYPSVVGDLVLVGKTGSDPNGTSNYDNTPGSLIAINKATGAILLDHEANTNFHAGVAIQDQYVLFGTGYLAYAPPSDVPGAINVFRVSG